jgi:cell wall-associated NlpC family hydrolase
MRRGKGTIARLAVAAVIAVPALVGSLAATSSATTTKQDVDAAKARLSQLNEQLAAAGEAYNEANVQLAAAEAKLADAKAAKDLAEKQAAAARGRLSDRAVAAYTGMGSQLDVLLNAESFADFSDRLEFMGTIAQSDADLATRADAAGQKAAWAAQDYANAVADAKAQVDAMRQQRERMQSMLTQQTSLYQQLNEEYQQQLHLQELALQRAAAAEAAAAANAGSSSPAPPPPPPPPDPGGGYVPPANASAASIAVNAALSQVGTPYVFGGASPGGFDCSGLTMWAWAQAGVSLPHSAYAQYSTLPKVPLSQVQPGDIIWYDSTSAHVALYVGGGQIVHARHPGPGGQVQTASMYGYDRPYAAMRPAT